MLSHGTVLFDSNLEEVVNALDVKMSKIESKGLKSVRSRVVNIAEFLKEEVTIEEFREMIVERIFGRRSEVPELEITDDDWEAIHKLRSEEHTSELQSRGHLVCRLLLEKKQYKRQ